MTFRKMRLTALLLSLLLVACSGDGGSPDADGPWIVPDAYVGPADGVTLADLGLTDLPPAGDASEPTDGLPAPDETPEDLPAPLPDQVEPEVAPPGDVVEELPLPETVEPDIQEPDVAPPEPEPLPYPTKTPYQVKGLQPDFWPDKNEIAGNGTGSVSMNLVWAFWEPSVEAPPCGGGEEEFDGRCFKIDGGVDGQIREYTKMGVVVTAVVYGVPAWARTQVDCSPVAPGFDIFCVPDNPADYGRFAGMLARRYNGLNDNGRIADFVIHNEVNANDWFDIGCGQGKACNAEQWMDAYADNYAAAYDAIVAQQPHAKVLMSFEHHFDTVFDKPSQQNPLLSVKTFVKHVAQKLGDREWRVAYHPYPPDLLKPQFSPDDLPKVTYGNLGIIVGWLMAEFPNDPHAWDVELTESGVNSLAPNSSEQAQADGVCRSLYNVTATPGITNYIYHRMKDHPAETAGGLGLGLVNDSGGFKQAWATWALSNRIDLDPPKLSCGFENLPYTRLVRGFKAGRGHWASTRKLPSGFAEEQVYKLHYAPQPGTKMLYECMVGNDSFVSQFQDCEGHQPMGPLGYIHKDPVPGGVALYRCFSGAAKDHMISPDPNCESYATEELLGYALPW